MAVPVSQIHTGDLWLSLATTVVSGGHRSLLSDLGRPRDGPAAPGPAEVGPYRIMCVMSLTFGPDRQTREFQCDCCNAPIERAWNFVYADGAPYAVYFANCYHHRDRDHDAWIDVIFGTWGVGSDQRDDHVSFACRVGPVVGQHEPASTLVTAGLAHPDGPLFGRKLDREAALRHPRLPEFWRVSDFVLENDPLVRGHIYGR